MTDAEHASNARPVSDAERRADDRLAVLAVLCGIAVAFLGRKIVLEMSAGVALGLGGALLAIRGGRAIEGRGWLSAALVMALFGALSSTALELYQEWQASQWFAEGAPTGAAPDEVRTLVRAVAVARIACIAGGLSFLLGALVNKISGHEKGPPGTKPGEPFSQ